MRQCTIAVAVMSVCSLVAMATIPDLGDVDAPQQRIKLTSNMSQWSVTPLNEYNDCYEILGVEKCEDTLVWAWTGPPGVEKEGVIYRGEAMQELWSGDLGIGTSGIVDQSLPRSRNCEGGGPETCVNNQAWRYRIYEKTGQGRRPIDPLVSQFKADDGVVTYHAAHTYNPCPEH